MNITFTPMHKVMNSSTKGSKTMNAMTSDIFIHAPQQSRTHNVSQPLSRVDHGFRFLLLRIFLKICTFWRKNFKINTFFVKRIKICTNEVGGGGLLD